MILVSCSAFARSLYDFVLGAISDNFIFGQSCSALHARLHLPCAKIALKAICVSILRKPYLRCTKTDYFCVVCRVCRRLIYPSSLKLFPLPAFEKFDLCIKNYLNWTTLYLKCSCMANFGFILHGNLLHVQTTRVYQL